MRYIKRLPGFRSGSPVRMVIATIGYLFVLLVVIGLLVPQNDEPETSAAEATATVVMSEPEPTATPSGPQVSDSAISEVVSLMTEYDGVDDAVVAVNGDTITIALHVRANMDADTARDHLDSAVRFLASQVALGNDDLTGPSADSLGDLWSHYRMEAGAWTDTETIIAGGAKEPSDAAIRWE